MEAVITSRFCSGLGDMHVGLYQIYNLQQELKSIGYNVSTKIDLGRSPYKIHGNDRNIFKRIFRFDLLDNFEILINSLEESDYNLSVNYELAYQYESIHKVYVSKKNKDIDTLKHVKDSWWCRDDLPKINLFSEEVTLYCEQQYQRQRFTRALHYRVYSSDNEDNIERDLDARKNSIEKVINADNSRIFVATNKQFVKDYCKSTYGDIVYVNPFIFHNVHDGIRDMPLNDEELFIVLKETLCDMYFLSHCNKIYRMADWFSAFLSFACLYNQTSTLNVNRFELV